MLDTTYQGAVAPESYKVTVKQGKSGIDLTTATAAQMLVQLPDGEDATWSASIVSGATALALVAVHFFGSGDLPQVGDYKVVVKLTVPGGFIRTPPSTLRVLPPFGTLC